MLQALPKRVLTRFKSQMLSPTQLIDELDIRVGDKVLEIGLPVGYFAPALLKSVKDKGSVYVSGPSEESLSKLSYLKHLAHLHTVLLADLLLGEGVPKDTINIAVLTNLLSKSSQPDKFCLVLEQYLKADSRIVLIDWDIKVKNIGPELKSRVSREKAIKLMSGCGFEFVNVLRTPGYHYGLVFGLKK